MDISVGLPNTVQGVSGSDLIAWAHFAEQAEFSSLSVGDRLIWPGAEPLLTLAAAAGCTERIRLSCEVLIAGARADLPLLAAQTSTLQLLSGGRFTLGVGAGARRDDFEMSGTEFATRGTRLDNQLEQLRELWGAGTVAPAVQDAPTVLIGGRSDATLSRMARWGDGTVIVAPPAMFAQRAEQALRVWQAAGRPGRPRLVAHSYYALGEDAPGLAAGHLESYYAFMGPMVGMFVSSALTSSQHIGAALDAYESAGADEVVLIPCGSSLTQLRLLADAVQRVSAITSAR